MLIKYLWIFFVSMVPLIELRGAIPIAVGLQLPLVPSYVVCVLGNMLPVPVIYLFARKVLEWGADKPVIGISWAGDRQVFLLVPGEGEKGGPEAPGEGGPRTVCGSAALCGNSPAGDRCLDRDAGGQSAGYGFQIQRDRGAAGGASGRDPDGGGQRGSVWSARGCLLSCRAPSRRALRNGD